MTALQTWSEPRPVRLTVDDYLRIAASGALDAHGRTELIDGMILEVSPEHRPHARVKTRLAITLAHALEESDTGLSLLIEGSVAMPPSHAPLPDLVTSEPDGEGLIPLSSVRLIVEVADSSLALDQGRKAALYAGNGVPEYWIVDVRAEMIHQQWAPAEEAYTERRSVKFGNGLDASTIGGLSLDTSGL